MSAIALLRQGAVAVQNVSRSRTFSSSVVSRKDLVQDLYLKELRAYKPPPLAKDAHVGTVKTFSHPPAPKPPVLPADLAAQLSQYDTSEPTKAEAVMTKADTSLERGEGAEEFLEFIEKDIPKPAAHDH